MVGHLRPHRAGTVRFQYDQAWLDTGQLQIGA
ncbi:MAG: hypothetical protein LBP55_06115 [Candidatus Adiutrix sp.]|nr:hypothetical protein [Candidatus Adiutrix sp.]